MSAILSFLCPTRFEYCSVKDNTLYRPCAFLYAKYRRRYALIEVAISPDPKIHVLIFVNKFPNLLFQRVLYLYDIVHVWVTKIGHRPFDIFVSIDFRYEKIFVGNESTLQLVEAVKFLPVGCS